MKKAVVFLIVITIVSKITGLFRDITLSFFYGASDISDAYIISMTIAIALFDIVVTGVITGFIPIYKEIEERKGMEEARAFSGNLLNIVLLLALFIVGVAQVFTKPIVLVFASGFSGEVLELAVSFTRISLLSIFFVGILYILQGFLQAQEKFYSHAFIGIPYNLVIMLFIWLSSIYSVYLIVWGEIIGVFMQVLVLFIFARKHGFRIRFGLLFKNEYVKKMLFLSLPVIIGVSTHQINILIDRTLASNIIEGGISALNYGDKVNLIIQGVFVLTMSTVLFPTISKMAVIGDKNGLRKAFETAANAINMIVIPLSFYLMIYSEDIVMLLFGRGAFDEQAVELTQLALFGYSFGILGFAYREIVSRFYFAFQDTKTPMYNSLIAIGINIVLNIILSYFLGILGLALATSISVIVAAALLIRGIGRKVSGIQYGNLLKTALRIVLATIAMLALGRGVHMGIEGRLSNDLNLIITSVVSGFIYLAMVQLLKIYDFKEFRLSRK